MYIDVASPPSLVPHLDIFVIQHSFQASRCIRSSLGSEAFIRARGICSEPSQKNTLTQRDLYTPYNHQERQGQLLIHRKIRRLKGIYVLAITTKKGEVSYKFIKEYVDSKGFTYPL